MARGPRELVEKVLEAARHTQTTVVSAQIRGPKTSDVPDLLLLTSPYESG
jgi:hypothetical protein